MSRLNQYLEMAKSKDSKKAKDLWWKKNYKALIDWCEDDPEGAAEMIWEATGGGDDEEEYEEFMTTEQDSSAKHKAENLLDLLSIKELNDLLFSEEK